ncbi:MAG: hypothetical protein WC506_00775 [Candidatus Micrarchaeia archaeon]
MRPFNFALVILAGLLVLGALHAFDPKDYLYSGEDANSIATSTFSIGTDVYTVVSYSGTETFLLKNNQIVQDQSAIKDAIQTNYLRSYQMSSSEITELEDLITAFNASRNFQTKYGPAERTCAQYTGQLNRDCNDPLSCQVSCSALPELCSPGFSSASPVDYNGKTEYLGNVYANILTDFALNRKALDQYYSTFMAEMSGVTTDNVISKLDTLINVASSMKATANKMDTSLLRGGDGVYYTQASCPSNETNCDVCPTCIGICPKMHFDYSSLDSAISKMAGYKARAAPLSKINTLPALIYTNTQDRLAYQQNVLTSGDYSVRYEALKKRHNSTLATARDVQSYVSNTTFNALVDSMIADQSTIEASLKTFQFNDLDTVLRQYDSDASKVDNMSASVKRPYLDALDAQQDVEAIVTRAQWRLDKTNKQQVDTYNELKATQLRYDDNFKPPYTPTDYTVLVKNYRTLENRTQSLINSYALSGNTAFLFIGNIARVTVDGVLGITNAIWPVTYKTRITYTPLIPPLAILIGAFSAISVAMFVFVGTLVKYKPVFRRKAVFFAWTLLLVVFIGVVVASSGAFYLLINQASTSTSFSDFYSVMNSSRNVVILADYTNATSAGTSAIDSCSAEVASQLKGGLGFDYTIIKIKDGKCTGSSAGNSTADSCLERLSDVPVIHIVQGTLNQPLFSVVYKKEALVNGDAAYIAKCDIASVLHT